MNEALRQYLASIGKLGGQAKSPAKTEAARENAKKPRKRLSDRSPHVAKLERQGKIKQVDAPTSPRESTVVLDGEPLPDYDP